MAIERKVLKQVLNEFHSGNLSNPKGLYQNPYVFPTINIFNTTNHTIPMGSKVYICGISGGGDTLSVAQQWMAGTIIFDVTDEDVTDYTKPDTLEGGLILARDGYYKNDSDRAAYCIVAEEIYSGGTGKASIDSLYATFVTCWEQEIDECMPKNCYTNKPLFVEQYNVDSRWAIYCGESASGNIKLYPSVEGCLAWYESGDNTNFARFCLNGHYVVSMSDLDDYSMSGDLESPTVYEDVLKASDRKIAFVVYREKEHVITKDNSLIHIEHRDTNPFGEHVHPAPGSETSQCDCVPFLTATDKATLNTLAYKTLSINSNGQSYVLPFSLVHNRLLPIATWNIDGSVVDSFDGDAIIVSYYFGSNILYPSITDFITFQYVEYSSFIAQDTPVDYAYVGYQDGHTDYTTFYNKSLLKWNYEVPIKSFDVANKELVTNEFTRENVNPNCQTIDVQLQSELGSNVYSIQGRIDASLLAFELNGISGIADLCSKDLRYIDIISLNLAPSQKLLYLTPDSTFIDYVYGEPEVPNEYTDVQYLNHYIDISGNVVAIDITDVNSDPTFLLTATQTIIDYSDKKPLGLFHRREGEYIRTLTPIVESKLWQETTYTKDGQEGYIFFPYELSLESGCLSDSVHDVVTSVENSEYVNVESIYPKNEISQYRKWGIDTADESFLSLNPPFVSNGVDIIGYNPNLYEGKITTATTGDGGVLVSVLVNGTSTTISNIGILYETSNPEFTPSELIGKDVLVSYVFSHTDSNGTHPKWIGWLSSILSETNESVSVAKSIPKSTVTIGTASENTTKNVLTSISSSSSSPVSVVTDVAIEEASSGSGTGTTIATGNITGSNSFVALESAGLPLFNPTNGTYLTSVSLISASGLSESNINYQNGFLVDNANYSGFYTTVITASSESDPNPTSLIQNIKIESTNSNTVLTDIALKQDGVESLAGVNVVKHSAGNSLSTLYKDGVVKNISVSIDSTPTQTLLKKLQLEGVDENNNTVWNDVTEVEFVSGVSCVDDAIVVTMKTLRVVAGSLTVTSTPINVVTDVVDNLAGSVITIEKENADIVRANIEQHTITPSMYNLTISSTTDNAVKDIGDNLVESSVVLETKEIDLNVSKSDVSIETLTYCQKYSDVTVITELDPVDVVKYIDDSSSSGSV